MHQHYNSYTPQDHQTWKQLTIKQDELMKTGLISTEYVDGYRTLRLNPDRIVRIKQLSTRLTDMCGWKLIPVGGLIPPKDFFNLLVQKIYPITVAIRREQEIDFSENPDIFHDVFGHLPLLTNNKFTDFLISYSAIALKYIENERAVEILARLYWYTYEMGLIEQHNHVKPYGGAIITSSSEIKNVQSSKIRKRKFELNQILQAAYNPFMLQEQYFVITSFDQLFGSIEKLEAALQTNLNEMESIGNES